jgi:hypothetical protein
MASGSEQYAGKNKGSKLKNSTAASKRTPKYNPNRYDSLYTGNVPF